MPNQNYLATIRETEERAEAMVAAAHADSRHSLDEARAEAARRIVAARAEADALKLHMLQEAAARSEAQSRDVIAVAEAEAGRIRAAAMPAMNEAVRIVAERIVK